VGHAHVRIAAELGCHRLCQCTPCQGLAADARICRQAAVRLTQIGTQLVNSGETLAKPVAPKRRKLFRQYFSRKPTRAAASRIQSRILLDEDRDCWVPWRLLLALRRCDGRSALPRRAIEISNRTRWTTGAFSWMENWPHCHFRQCGKFFWQMLSRSLLWPAGSSFANSCRLRSRGSHYPGSYFKQRCSRKNCRARCARSSTAAV
jgi:hypothetical protein